MQKARSDIYSFGEHVFGFRPAEHHREMVDFILDRIANHENGVVLEPRSAAKTTWGDTIFLAYIIGKLPDIRVGLLSNTDSQAFAFSRAVRWTLQSSDPYKEVFGNLVSQAKWTDKEWLRAGSKNHSSKDLTLYASGTGGPIISKRFDLILCDDILDEENTYTIDRRERVETWFWKTVKPCLVPGGSIIVLGTRWSEGDLYERLIDHNHWPSLVKAAISVDEEGNESSYWPAQWPIEALHREREDVGSDNFACSYLNDISGLREGNIFRREWFQYFDKLPPDKHYTYTMGIDLATSERERADYTARCIVAEDDEHNHYVLSAFRAKTESGHKQFVIDGYSAFPKISKIIIENNQFQSTLVQNLLGTTNLPVVGRKTDSDKRTRLRAIAARYEGHKVYHHRSLKGSAFEIELLGFPKGHDDMADALSMACDLQKPGLVWAAL